MRGLQKNIRIIFGVVLFYLLNKFIVRPYILKGDFIEELNILVLSFPNLCEAIVGSLFLTNVGLIANAKILKTNEIYIYSIAIIFASIYVILQELKIHNLGGENVYDHYDVLFSVVGLLITFIFLVIDKPKWMSNE
ncbi:hypothetical protein D1816_15050 [Aquimarina sp. AD10]|uniref:VanZ-like domain-containing protein n=1 Tax=Aquimarina aggregata TaxID=1642818 RepID=A0A162WGV5_9FLAO|nr:MULTISPECIES: hypothetical protein [Aquimarina]AXT61611.1 hypothetical protein D1816_15050 [Aquimarina sp. AD10]KZS38091.1 hypothetical protein AWE51_18775 [Aquimarina aggregata]RKN01040.1 hypothetical protein D7033_06715 [Aquimarina sp. AD10]